MPCDQYELHLENSVAGPNENQDLPVASLDQSTSTVTAVQLGHINVVLDHKSILLENYSISLKKKVYIILILFFVFCHGVLISKLSCLDLSFKSGGVHEAF